MTRVPWLPLELWLRILTFLPLRDLWECGRPVCIVWNDFAKEIARRRLYFNSKIEVSTLINEMDGFQHYEGDSLYPIIDESDIDVLSFSSPASFRNNGLGRQRLIWARQGSRTHQWTLFHSPENIWPNVIKYQPLNAETVGIRLDYDFEFSPVNGGDKVFTRHPQPMPLASHRADWRIRVKVNHDGDESLAAISIPLWQLVQLCLKGSVFGDGVEELAIGESQNGSQNNGHSYYVWTSE